MKEVRGVDLDEVEFETLDAILEFHDYKINGIQVTREDITDYHIHNIKKLNISKDESNERFHSFLRSEKVHDIKPVQ